MNATRLSIEEIDTLPTQVGIAGSTQPDAVGGPSSTATLHPVFIGQSPAHPGD